MNVMSVYIHEFTFAFQSFIHNNITSKFKFSDFLRKIYHAEQGNTRTETTELIRSKPALVECGFCHNRYFTFP